MNILGIIPARYASSRLPGKSLIDIDGVPMIARVYEQSIQAEGLSDVLVATDDKRIAEAMGKCRIPCVLTSSAHPNGTSRCWETYQMQQKTYDFVVNIQGDEPFLRPQQIEKLIHLIVTTPGLCIGTLIKKMSDPNLYTDPHTVKVVCDAERKVLYFSRSPIPYTSTHPKRRALSDYPVYKHVGLYAYHPKVLEELTRLPSTPLEEIEHLEQLRWLVHGYTIHTAETDIDSISIDTMEDLRRAHQRGLLKQLPRSSTPHTHATISALDN